MKQKSNPAAVTMWVILQIIFVRKEELMGLAIIHCDSLPNLPLSCWLKASGEQTETRRS